MIRSRVGEAIVRAQAAGELPAVAVERVEVEVPADPAHGDYATNAAMMLARPMRMAPSRIAQTIVRYLDLRDSSLSEATVAGPGFVNFRLGDDFKAPTLQAVLGDPEHYGASRALAHRHVLLEFVSANPTGPLNVVSARAAAFGDTLAAVLECAGARVVREFYVNDAGAQVLRLGQSLRARILEQTGQPFVPVEQGYAGEYLVDVARAYLQEHGVPQEGADADRELGSYAVAAIMAGVRQDLLTYGVRFDSFFSERELHERGAVRDLLAELQARGETYAADGAVWIRTSAHGDDKDRVVVRSDSTPTYLAGDLAYHRDKLRRGFTELVDVVGPDHHSHTRTMEAGMRALGAPGRLRYLVVQHMRLVHGETAVKMSKRGGDFVPLTELVAEVGRDAARFFFLMRAHTSPLDFDLELAKREGQENPVFYVQYAHARIQSLLRQADAPQVNWSARDLDHPEERQLLVWLARFPEEVLWAAERMEPHRLTRYAQDLAGAFHGFYTRHRIWGEAPEVTARRLALAQATGIVLRRCLALLGVSAPDRM